MYILYIETSCVFVGYGCIQSLGIKMIDIFKQAYRKLAKMMVEEVCITIYFTTQALALLSYIFCCSLLLLFAN